MSTNKYLHYGDQIQIFSAENPMSFLAGRSVIEEDMYVMKCPYFPLNSLHYENPNEFLFAIHPKLHYEAYKEFQKVKPSDQKTKVELLRKRMEAEVESNDKRVKLEHGAAVRVGSDVQLYHVLSRSYVRATREKNAKGNNLIYNLKLSRKGGSGLMFKIIPYYSFKKEGERLFTTDKFYLENPKLHAFIVYKKLPEITKPLDIPIRIPPQIKPDATDRQNNPDKSNTVSNTIITPVSAFGQEKTERKTEAIPLLELSKHFQQFEAGLRVQDPSCAFMANVIHPVNTNYHSKWLQWGDFVRIKYQRKNDKATGFLFSDPTIIGSAPEVYLRYVKGTLQHERESFQSIFQLIPGNEMLLGRPIVFEDTTISIQLRHVLTGRYLKISDARGSGMLSMTLDEYLSLNSPAAYEVPKDLNANSPMATQNSAHFSRTLRDLRTIQQKGGWSTPGSMRQNNFANMKVIPNLDRSSSVAFNKKASERGGTKEPLTPGLRGKNEWNTSNNMDYSKNMDALKDRGYSADIGYINSQFEGQEPDDNNPFYKFYKETSVLIENASGDGDEVLSTTSCFSIKSSDPASGHMLGVDTNNPEDQNAYWKRSIYPDDFKPRFHEPKIDPLEKTDYPTHYDDKSEDFFFFQPIGREDISELTTVYSKLYPIMVVAEKGDSPSDQIKRAVDSLNKLERWLTSTNSNDNSNSKHDGALNFVTKQKMMREVGVIDLIIKLIKGYYNEKLLQGELNTPTDYKNVNAAAIQLLMAIIKKNKVNSVYTFQWDAFFMEMILSEMVLKDLGIDSLLSRLFYETDASMSSLSDTLPKVAGSLLFGKYDNKALNIAIALCLYNPRRSKRDQDRINEILLENATIRNQLFKKMYIQDDGSTICVEVSNSEHIYIDPSVEYKNKKQFDYTTNVIRLGTELARGKPEVVATFLGEFFQPEICATVFANRKLNATFRSVFAELFLEMYMVPESRLIRTQKFPNRIKFLYGIKMEDILRDHFANLQKEVIDRILFVGEYNIKTFIKEYLEDIHLLSKEEHKLTKSIMSMIHFLLEKGLYEREEVKKLKMALYNYLKYGLAAIHMDVNKNDNLSGHETTDIVLKADGREMNYSHDEMQPLREKSNGGMTIDVASPAKIENNKMETRGDQDDNSFDQDNYLKTGDENQDMINWMQELISVLLYIEDYEMDKKISDFIEDERNSKYFNDRILFKTELPKNQAAENYINKLKKEKEGHILKYLSDCFVLQHYNNTLVLIELLLLGNLNLTCQIVHLLYLNFTQHEYFLRSLNQTEVVDVDNIEIYNTCVRVFDELSICNSNLFIEKSPKVDLATDILASNIESTTATEQYIKVNNTLKYLLNDILVRDINPEEHQKYYHVYDEYHVELSSIKLMQTLVRNLEFIPLLEKLFNGLKEGYVRDKTLKASITEHFLLFFIFFCINNPQNQELLAESSTFIANLFEISIPEVYPLILHLISEIFKDNYPMLMNIARQDSEIVPRMFKKFFFHYRNRDYKSMIYAIRIFPVFFQIQDNYLSQNQVYLSREFRNLMINNSTSSNQSRNINKVLYDELLEFLKKTKVESCVAEKENPDNLDAPVVNVPIEISFAVHTLKTFAIMAAGRSENGTSTIPSSSNATVALNNKQFLTISQIKDLLKVCDEWYNLRLALVSFLNYTYIANKKLEDNEVTELFDIVKYTLMKELNEYIRFLKNRELYHRPPGQRFAESYPKYFTVSTELYFSEDIDHCYDQYAIYGLLDSFRHYVERMKAQPQQQDVYFLDDYLSTVRELREVWMTNSPLKKMSLFKGGMKMLNKMIDPLREPSEPDLLEFSSDLDILTKNEFKNLNATAMRNEILRTVVSIQRSARAEPLNIRKKESVLLAQRNYESQINNWRWQLSVDNAIIEQEYNSELEILVKFLLELKLDNTEKFKKIIGGFMTVLSNDDTSQEIKNYTLKILRKLSNFKVEQKLYESIQNDLFELKFVSFLCEVIVEAKDDYNRLEFILGMIDFLDEASERIQKELLHHIMQDEENEFLVVLKTFIVHSFEDFREHEKNYKDQSSEIQKNARIVLLEKMYATMHALEVIRLACENHFEPMQNYLREQVQDGIVIKRSVNFITVISEIFNKYVKSINETNSELGIKIFDTIIEMLQGPCTENQESVCNTKFLENVEDLMVELQVRNDETRDSSGTSSLDSKAWLISINEKIITFIQAILEGSFNEVIVNKISLHINPVIFLERMEKIFSNYYKLSKKSKKRLMEADVTDLKNTQSLMIYSSRHMIEADVKKEIKGRVLQEDRANDFLKEGSNIYIIIKLLEYMSPAIQERIRRFWKEFGKNEKTKKTPLPYLRATKYYESHTGVIEIVNKRNGIQKIYFPLLKKTKFLSNSTKILFEDKVNRETLNEKLFGLLRNQNTFIDEMELFLKWRRRGLRFNLTMFTYIRDINLILAIITNILILALPISDHQHLVGSSSENSSADNAVKVLAIVQIIISLAIFALWMVFRMPLDLKSAKEIVENHSNYIAKKKKHTKGLGLAWTNFYYFYKLSDQMLFNTSMLYLALYTVITCLGLFVSKVFFAFLLLDLIDRSVILNNVIKSITLNHKQLIMTAVLGVMLIYIWAVLGYFYLRDIYEFNNAPSTSDGEDLSDTSASGCNSIWECFLTLVNQGLRSGGGIGDVLNQPAYQDGNQYAKRFFYDLLFFIMIIIILLNIIFGIIIDTFAELRDLKRTKDYDMKNMCFICNIDRAVFEKEAKSFENHVKYEHNLWNYLYFIVYLKAKNPLDYNGTESYIAEKLEQEDLSWFPMNRAMSLASTEGEDDEDMKKLIDERLSKFESRIGTMMGVQNIR